MAEAKETILEENVSADWNRRQPGAGKSESLHPLLELTATRVREFLREKEAVFWVFIFPVLMTFALGVAFAIQRPTKHPLPSKPRRMRRQTRWRKCCRVRLKSQPR